ncbi:hypothetical protein KKB43_01850 [Patescibacteria group bacterium]|nr:hypothetical protein [Patescibacteria group bacterium]
MFLKNITIREKEIYQIALVIIFASFFIDIVTTWYGVSYFGEKEGAPVAFWLMRHYGFNEAIILGTLVKIAALIVFVLLFNKINNKDSKALGVPKIILAIPSLIIALVAVFYLIMMANNLLRIII